MAWDGVPWFVGGGAEHSPEIARVLSYAAFGGTEGIIGSGDLRVEEQPVPDSTVRVFPGACSILNRASAQDYQAYAARLPSADTVAISPTDSTGGRSDLIVARVEDPFLSGEPWADPSNPKVGPYVFTRVVPDVPAGTTSLQEVEPGQSGIALARVDLPVSTGTVTQSMIQDLRVLPRPQRETKVFVHNQTAGDNTLTNSSFEMWPLQANWDVEIPEWAVGAQIIGNIAGYRIVEGSTQGGNVFGQFRARLGSVATASTAYNHSVPAGLGQIDNAATAVADEVSIPASMRGTTQNLRLEARRNGGSSGCNLETGVAQITAFQVFFFEAPD